MNYLFNKSAQKEPEPVEKQSRIMFVDPEDMQDLDIRQEPHSSTSYFAQQDLENYRQSFNSDNQGMTQEMEMEPIFPKKTKVRKHKLHKSSKKFKHDHKAWLKSQMKREKHAMKYKMKKGLGDGEAPVNLEDQIDDDAYFQRLEEERAIELAEERKRKIARRNKKAEMRHMASLYGDGRPKALVEEEANGDLRRRRRKPASEYIEFETERDRRIHWRDTTGNADPDFIVDNLVGNVRSNDCDDFDLSDGYEIPLPPSPDRKIEEEEIPFNEQPTDESAQMQSKTMDLMKLRRRAPALHLPKSNDDLFCPNGLLLDILGIYEPIRRYSRVLRISPFRLEDFIMALASKEYSQLLGEIHIVLLKVILREDELLGSILSVPDCKDSINLSFHLLDRFSWPFLLKSYLDGLKRSEKSAISALKNSPDISNNAIFNCNPIGGSDRMLTTELFDPSVIPVPPEYPNVSIECRIKILTGLVGMFMSTGLLRGEILKQGIEPHEDHCRICHESGEVLCCDNCPAVFHLSCFKPPLTSVPSSTWICPVCEKHTVSGITECISPEEKAGFAHRLLPLGRDRAGRIYWHVSRRIIVETVDFTLIEPELRNIIPAQIDVEWENNSILAAKKRKLRREGLKISDENDSEEDEYSSDNSTSCSESEEGQSKLVNRHYQQLCDPIKEYSNQPNVHLFSTYEKVKELRGLLSAKWEPELCYKLDRLISNNQIEKEMQLTLNITMDCLKSFESSLDKYNLPVELANSRIVIAPIINMISDQPMKEEDAKTLLPFELGSLYDYYDKENVMGPFEKVSDKGPMIKIDFQNHTLTTVNIDRKALTTVDMAKKQHKDEKIILFTSQEIESLKRASISNFPDTSLSIHSDSPEFTGPTILILFRLGDEGGWRKWVNYYSNEFGLMYKANTGREDAQINIALSRIQHLEERESKKLLYMKFSLINSFTRKNFAFIEPSVVNDLLPRSDMYLIDTMKFTIANFESFIPLGLMSPAWNYNRENWLKELNEATSVKTLSRLLIQLESVIRPNCFHRLWLHSIGCLEVERITLPQKEEDKRMRLLDRSGLTLPGYMTPELLKKAAEMAKNNPPSTLIKTKNAKGIIHTIWKIKGEEYRRLGGDGWCWISKSLSMNIVNEEVRITCHQLSVAENMFIHNAGMQHGLGWSMFSEYLENETPIKPPLSADCRGHVCHPMTGIPLYMNKRRTFYKIPVDKLYIPRREDDPFEVEKPSELDEEKYHSVLNISRGLRYRIHYPKLIRKNEDERNKQIELAKDPNSKMTSSERRRLLFRFEDLLSKRLQAKDDDKVTAELAKDDLFNALKTKDDADFAYQDLKRKFEALGVRAQELRTAKARAVKAKQDALAQIKQENELLRQMEKNKPKPKGRKQSVQTLSEDQPTKGRKRRSARPPKRSKANPDFIADFDGSDSNASDMNTNSRQAGKPKQVKRKKQILEDFIVPDDDDLECGTITETEDSDIDQFDGTNDKFFDLIDQLDGTKRSRNDSSDDAGARIDDDSDPEFDIGQFAEKKKKAKKVKPTSSKKSRLDTYEDEEDDDFDSGTESSEDDEVSFDKGKSDESHCSTFSDYEKKDRSKKTHKEVKKVKTHKKANQSPKKKPHDPSKDYKIEKAKIYREGKKMGLPKEEIKAYYKEQKLLRRKQEKKMKKREEKSSSGHKRKQPLSSGENSPMQKKPTSSSSVIQSNPKKIKIGYEDEMLEETVPQKSPVKKDPSLKPPQESVKPLMPPPQPAEAKNKPVIRTVTINSQGKPSISAPKLIPSQVKTVQLVKGTNGFIRVTKPQGNLEKTIEKPIEKTIEKPTLQTIEKPIVKPLEKPIVKPLVNTLPETESAMSEQEVLADSVTYDDEEPKKIYRPSILKRKPLPPKTQSTEKGPEVQKSPLKQIPVNDIKPVTPAAKKMLPKIQMCCDENDVSKVSVQQPQPPLKSVVIQKSNLTYTMPNGVSVTLARPNAGPLSTGSTNIASDIATATAKKMFSVQRLPPKPHGVMLDLSKVRQVTPNSVMITNKMLSGLKSLQPQNPNMMSGSCGRPVLPLQRPLAPRVLDASHDLKIEKIDEELLKIDAEINKMRADMEAAKANFQKASDNLHNEQVRMEEATKGTAQPYSLNKLHWKKYPNLKWNGRRFPKGYKPDRSSIMVAVPKTLPPYNPYTRKGSGKLKSWSLFALSPKYLRPLILSGGRKDMIRYEAEKKRSTQAVWPYPSSRPCMSEAWRFNLVRYTSSGDEKNIFYETSVLANHLRMLWANLKWQDMLYDPIEVLLEFPATDDRCPVAVDHRGLLFTRQPSDINECFILRRIVEVEPLDKHWLMSNFLLRTESYKNISHTIDIDAISKHFNQLSGGRFFKKKRQYHQDLQKLGLEPKKRGRKPGQVKKKAADPDYDPNFDDFDDIKPGKRTRGRPKKKTRPGAAEEEGEKSSDDSCDPYEEIEEMDPNYMPTLEDMDEVIPGLATAIMEDGENKITGHGISSVIDDWISEEGLLLWEIRFLMDCFFSPQQVVDDECLLASRLAIEKDWPSLITPKELKPVVEKKTEADPAVEPIKSEDDAIKSEETNNEMDTLEGKAEEDEKPLMDTSNESNKENECKEVEKKDEDSQKNHQNHTNESTQKIVELLQKELTISGLLDRSKFCLANDLIRSCIKPPPNKDELKVLEEKQEKIKKMVELRMPTAPDPESELVNSPSFSRPTERTSDEKSANKKISASQAAKVSAIVRRAKAVKTNIESRTQALSQLYQERKNLTFNMNQMIAETEFSVYIKAKLEENQVKRDEAKRNQKATTAKASVKRTPARKKQQDPNATPTAKATPKAPASRTKSVKRTKAPPKTAEVVTDEISDLSETEDILKKPLVSRRRGVLTPATRNKVDPKQMETPIKGIPKSEDAPIPNEEATIPSTPQPKKTQKRAPKSETKASTNRRQKKEDKKPEQNEELFCLCRKPYDASKEYIGCDKCQDWFHFNCVGMTKEKMDSTSDSWVCPKCSITDGEAVDDRLYCLCRTLYDINRVYIACDSCDQWFHPECIGMSNEEAANQDASDFYICPTCKEKEVVKTDENLKEGLGNKSTTELLANKFKLEGELLEKTVDFLNELEEHPMAKPFLKPYDKSKYPQSILESIKNPIDIETIQRKMANGDYLTILEISRDLNLIFENSKLAHLDEAMETKCANLLEIFVEKEIASLKQINNQS